MAHRVAVLVILIDEGLVITVSAGVAATAGVRVVRRRKALGLVVLVVFVRCILIQEACPPSL